MCRQDMDQGALETRIQSTLKLFCLADGKNISWPAVADEAQPAVLFSIKKQTNINFTFATFETDDASSIHLYEKTCPTVSSCAKTGSK